MKGSKALVFLRNTLLAALLMVVALPAGVQAEQSAGAWVGDLGKKVVQILQQTEGQPDKRKSELEAVFLDSFDVDFIGKFVVGRYWRSATDEQRSEFMQILPDYVATVYAALFAGYEGDGFKVTKETDDSDGSFVEGEILRNNGPSVGAAFTIVKPSGRYLIKNATVEGVSLLVTKRSEFSSVLSREGMDGLIERMKQVLNS